jgi:phenylalanyl-tRNA synthetase beta chain
MSGLKIEESPKWLQNRLKAIGIAPKNNVVDVTNYVLHELGQPLHAFDADHITDNKIKVKTLPAGTKFTTLDEVERELHEEDLMICDSKKPLCIAGVFGGLNSGVTENTSNVFLESAYFNPVSVRKTAKRHGLNTDASFRFERGIDPNITEYALKRAVLLIQKTAGGLVTSDIDDIYPKKIEDFQVFLTFDKINNLIGQVIDPGTIKSILASLEIRVNNVTESGLGLTIPAYRVDVQREVDVIEEILRVYGYNNVEFNDKLNASISNSTRFEDYRLQNIIADQLVGQGFYEAMSNSLTTKDYIQLTESLEEAHNVEMLNPLSQDLAVLRQSLLFSGLETISYNLNRKNNNLKFFEFGKTYHHFPSGREEQKHLALFLSGNKSLERWNATPKKSDFFFAKGVIEAILEKLGLEQLTHQPVSDSIFSEGLNISIQKKKIVNFGVVKKSVLKKFAIDQEVIFADFNWDQIIELVKNQKIKFKLIPKFPSTRRDFALLLDDKVSFKEVYNIATKTERKVLKDVALFDVYEGKNLPEGKKSYAVSFSFLDENKTLTDKQVDKIMKKLQLQFEKQLGASLR